MPMEIAVQKIDARVHDEQQCCDMRQTRRTEVTRDTRRPGGGGKGARGSNRPRGHNGITNKQDNRVRHQDVRNRGGTRITQKKKE